MYEGLRVVVVSAVFDEAPRIARVLERMPWDVVDEAIVVDDGSTDGSGAVARERGARVVRLERRGGVGRAVRAALAAARDGSWDVLVSIGGNGKDDPREIPRLLAPIAAGHDFVMGSRWLPGGERGGDFPLYRRIATRVHPFLVGLLCGKRITESTNGFRAIRRAVLDDPRIDLEQAWLDGYELEVYLLMRVLRLGYRTCEVPVSKRYPPRREGITKMRPVLDWWRMLRPVLWLGLGLRR